MILHNALGNSILEGIVNQESGPPMTLFSWNTCIDSGVLSLGIESTWIFEGDFTDLILNLKKKCQNREDYQPYLCRILEFVFYDTIGQAALISETL